MNVTDPVDSVVTKCAKKGGTPFDIAFRVNVILVAKGLAPLSPDDVQQRLVGRETPTVANPPTPAEEPPKPQVTSLRDAARALNPEFNPADKKFTDAELKFVASQLRKIRREPTVSEILYMREALARDGLGNYTTREFLLRYNNARKSKLLEIPADDFQPPPPEAIPEKAVVCIPVQVPETPKRLNLQPVKGDTLYQDIADVVSLLPAPYNEFSPDEWAGYILRHGVRILTGIAENPNPREQVDHLIRITRISHE